MPDVTTEEERFRFRVAIYIARQEFGDENEALVWQTARSVYRQNPAFTD